MFADKLKPYIALQIRDPWSCFLESFQLHLQISSVYRSYAEIDWHPANSCCRFGTMSVCLQESMDELCESAELITSERIVKIRLQLKSHNMPKGLKGPNKSLQNQLRVDCINRRRKIASSDMECGACLKEEGGFWQRLPILSLFVYLTCNN